MMKPMVAWTGVCLAVVTLADLDQESGASAATSALSYA